MIRHTNRCGIFRSFCASGMRLLVFLALLAPTAGAQDVTEDLESLGKRVKALDQKLDEVLRGQQGGEAREPASPPLAAEPVYDGKPASYWVRALADRNNERAEAAERAIAALGESAVDALLVAVKADDWLWRGRAVVALGALAERGGERAANAILASAKDVHPLVRSTALDTVVSSLTSAARDRAEIEKSVRPIERDIPALEAYVRTLVATVPATVVAALEDKDLRVRIRAAWGVANVPLKDAKAVEGLRARLTDTEPLVRQEAAFALARANNDASVEAVPMLAGLLKAEVQFVRANRTFSSFGHAKVVAAIQALGSLGPKAARAVPALEELRDVELTPPGGSARKSKTTPNRRLISPYKTEIERALEAIKGEAPAPVEK